MTEPDEQLKAIQDREYYEASKGVKPVVSSILEKLKQDMNANNPYVCPKCGQPMAHFRLHGLKCMVCR